TEHGSALLVKALRHLTGPITTRQYAGVEERSDATRRRNRIRMAEPGEIDALPPRHHSALRDDSVFDRPQALDFCPDHVTDAKPVAGGGGYASRRAGCNDIPRHQRHDLSQV